MLKIRKRIAVDGPGKRRRYSDYLGAGRSGHRIRVEARFSVPIQTKYIAHPAPYTMGIGSFPLTETSTRDISLGGKGGQCVGMTPSGVDFLEEP